MSWTINDWRIRPTIDHGSNNGRNRRNNAESVLNPSSKSCGLTCRTKVDGIASCNRPVLDP
jgi:hypothetical protein